LGDVESRYAGGSYRQFQIWREDQAVGASNRVTPRYKLRTLLILLAILPPLLAVGWSRYTAWRAEQVRRAELDARRQAYRAQMAALQKAARAKVQALVAAEIAEREARRAARERVDDPDDATRVGRLQRAGYLPAQAAPRIQPPPAKAPAKAAE
jgi:hypothetical protein